MVISCSSILDNKDYGTNELFNYIQWEMKTMLLPKVKRVKSVALCQQLLDIPQDYSINEKLFQHFNENF